MPRLVHDPEYYRQYAQTPNGKAARAKARANWTAKRKAERIAQQQAKPDANPLITAWRNL